MGMTFGLFRQHLKAVNRRMEFRPGPRISSGVYLRFPQHPDVQLDADDYLQETGASGVWYHLCSMPSPRFFTTIPTKNRYVTDRKKRLDDETHTMVFVDTQRMIARGVREFGRILLGFRRDPLLRPRLYEPAIRALMRAA